MKMFRSYLFWILITSFTLRLVHLDAPLIGMHSWRQADTAAVARNFHENGRDLLKPQIDFGGTGPGHVDMEFPLYSYIVACAYGFTGVHEWFGRLWSALCWAALIAAMYDLARWAGGRRIARWTAAFMAFLPLNLYYGRVFMPEPMLLAGMAGGLVYFRKWLDTPRPAYYWASWLAITVACLLKIPSLYIGLPLAWLAWYKLGWRSLRRVQIWLFAVLLLLAVGSWYAYSHQVGRESGISFGIFAYGTDKWGKWHLLTTWHYWNSVLFKSLAERHLAWGGFILFLVGLFLPRPHSRYRLFDWWLAAILVYLVVVQGGNLAHEYYQLPVILPVTFLMARGVDWLLCNSSRRRTGQILAAFLLLVTARLGTFRWLDYLSLESPAKSVSMALARHISEHTELQERGVFLNDGNPTIMYLAHRKGWNASPDDLVPSWLAQRAAEGATFVAGRVNEMPGRVYSLGRVIRSADDRVVIIKLGQQDGHVPDPH